MTDRDEACIFCKIASGEMGTEFVYESPDVVAFDDLAPQAPTHVLVVPRLHVPDVTHLAGEHRQLAGEMIEVSSLIAAQRGLTDSGFRILTNVGPDAGQTVHHMHWHVLGGAKLGKMG
jgi:histidine triad (HIT) family protein